MEKALAHGIVRHLGPERTKAIRDASRLLDLIEQRKREGRVRVLRSRNR